MNFKFGQTIGSGWDHEAETSEISGQITRDENRATHEIRN
jgi:hypothetical protein